MPLTVRVSVASAVVHGLKLPLWILRYSTAV